CPPPRPPPYPAGPPRSRTSPSAPRTPPPARSPPSATPPSARHCTWPPPTPSCAASPSAPSPPAASPPPAPSWPPGSCPPRPPRPRPKPPAKPKRPRRRTIARSIPALHNGPPACVRNQALPRPVTDKPPALATTHRKENHDQPRRPYPKCDRRSRQLLLPQHRGKSVGGRGRQPSRRHGNLPAQRRTP